jgi:hypothetical protein
MMNEDKKPHPDNIVNDASLSPKLRAVLTAWDKLTREAADMPTDTVYPPTLVSLGAAFTVASFTKDQWGNDGVEDMMMVMFGFTCPAHDDHVIAAPYLMPTDDARAMSIAILGQTGGLSADEIGTINEDKST